MNLSKPANTLIRNPFTSLGGGKPFESVFQPKKPEVAAAGKATARQPSPFTFGTSLFDQPKTVIHEEKSE